MKHSKHFRKDVVIARLIFCVICAVILGLVTSGVTTLLENKKDSETEDFVSESTILGTESETETDTQLEEHYVIARVNVKLRTEPNTDCEVITTVSGGDRLLLLEEHGDWYKVLYREKEGFISAEYAQKEVIERESENEGGAEITGNRSDYVIMIDPAKEQLHFDIATLLKQELESRGYVTKITRSIDESNITAQQRAEIAKQAGADITIGIHTGSTEDTAESGAVTIAPSSANTSVGTLAEKSQKLSQEVINAYCTRTGMENDGVMIDDTKEEINYTSMPVTIISLGYISNPSDSSNMQDSEYQKKMVQGIADGIDIYFITVQSTDNHLAD